LSTGISSPALGAMNGFIIDITLRYIERKKKSIGIKQQKVISKMEFTKEGIRCTSERRMEMRENKTYEKEEKAI
jgi:uncharacterized DUF497 family protein